MRTNTGALSIFEIAPIANIDRNGCLVCCSNLRYNHFFGDFSDIADVITSEVAAVQFQAIHL
jgi:hypothetical protein